MSTKIPSENNKELTLSRLQRQALHYIGTAGVTEIRGRFRDAYLFLECFKEQRGGSLFHRLGRDTVVGVGKLARLEYLGPDKWKFLIYKSDIQKYGPLSWFGEGTIEECLDAAAKVFLDE